MVLKLKSLLLLKENSLFGLEVLYLLLLLLSNNHGSLKKNSKKLELLLYTENVSDNYFYFILFLIAMTNSQYENSKLNEILNFQKKKSKNKNLPKFDQDSEDTRES